MESPGNRWPVYYIENKEQQRQQNLNLHKKDTDTMVQSARNANQARHRFVQTWEKRKELPKNLDKCDK